MKRVHITNLVLIVAFIVLYILICMFPRENFTQVTSSSSGEVDCSSKTPQQCWDDWENCVYENNQGGGASGTTTTENEGESRN